MTYLPKAGLALVRPIDTEDTLPGGKILLSPSYRASLTAQQAEIVAIGPPQRCHEPETCNRPHTTTGRHVVDQRLVPGAWVLCAKWSYVEVAPDLYAVAHEALIGVFPASAAQSTARPSRRAARSAPGAHSARPVNPGRGWP